MVGGVRVSVFRYIKPKMSLNNRRFSLSKSQQSIPTKISLTEQFEQCVWTVLWFDGVLRFLTFNIFFFIFFSIFIQTTI